jgi:hypothetical protein
MELLEALDIIAKLPSQAKMAETAAKEIRRLKRVAAELQRSNTALEALRPVWAQGRSSDSAAAQASSAALAEIWEVLGVADQTAAMEKLRELKG